MDSGQLEVPHLYCLELNQYSDKPNMLSAKLKCYLP